MLVADICHLTRYIGKFQFHVSLTPICYVLPLIYAAVEMKSTLIDIRCRWISESVRWDIRRGNNNI